MTRNNVSVKTSRTRVLLNFSDSPGMKVKRVVSMAPKEKFKLINFVPNVQSLDMKKKRHSWNVFASYKNKTKFDAKCNLAQNYGRENYSKAQNRTREGMSYHIPLLISPRLTEGFDPELNPPLPPRGLLEALPCQQARG